MSSTKERKINKLRKAHIWPSVVFLISSIILAAVAVCILIALVIAYLTSDRATLVIANTASVLHSIDENAENAEDIVRDVPRDSELAESVLILDGSGNIIAGFGAPTYDKENIMNELVNDGLVDETVVGKYIDREYMVYADKDFDENLIDKEGNLNILSVLSPENRKIFSRDKFELEDILFKAIFWMEFKLRDGRTAMIQCVLPYYYKDFRVALIMGAIAFGLMFIPIVFLFVNVIMNVKNQKRMTKLLYTDTITAGNSMMYFEHTANKALTSRRKSVKLYAIVDITLMKYRSYCNYHGIKAGEELLENVDKQIKTHLGKNEFCAHSGKSSFAVFMDCGNKESCEKRIRETLNDLSDTFGHGGITFHAGIYYSEPAKPREITDSADCFNRAGAARAVLTDENSTAVTVYNDKLLEEQIWEHHVEEKMQQALENEEFQVYIQPKYNPVTEKLAGAEALVRWVNEEDGFVPPGKFIPIFEKNGFITKLDDYMLSHVAKLQAGWLSEGKEVVPVSVNVSRAHFANPDLAQHISRLVDEYAVPHNLIEIELTESAFFDDKAALLRTVHSLGELGFEISMDDFGAGYSSLNSLKDLPLDVLKLDADFFRGEDSENRGEIVVSQAIALAKKLNMRIVAEGVEKKEQVDFLAGQGCDMIQGYYFAKPMPAAEYAERL